jgi:putative tricarboxylic transport membrane protein
MAEALHRDLMAKGGLLKKQTSLSLAKDGDMRQADIMFALGLLVLARLVAWESLALNIGWGINGPEGGFFPFWLAVGLGLCSLMILGQAIWRAAPALHKPLVASGGWVALLTVAIPAIAMVALSECIGLYPATALYLAFYMRWVGQHRWPWSWW